ncbi:GLPGLI family protein [Chryseobacterium culicis]|uniref:GLPGLI family protein n=1 Tax=Chryseobacterium culicis TaxID=680127 RepID=A0A2S9CWE3_CHRCI|nr:GLPGLI family protein [Chryseobacterium culicis]PRB84842.1 hypothetical protein CQ022_00790 [Chryseobacterium culicis]PRB87759.1 hypothetical protein CQ033_20085 [Chryseobacterium culicis]
MVKIFSLIIILMDSIFVFSQDKNTVLYSNLICKYHVKFLKDSTNKSSEREEIMTLFIGDNVSLFKSDQKVKSDSLKEAIVKNSMNNITSGNLNIDFSKVPRVNMNQEVFLRDGKLKVYDKVFKNLFSFEPANKVEWNLLNETKKINGYNCKKAIGKYGMRELTAWYTLDIPISEGPYTFKGLPGLVIYLEDQKQTYSFELFYLKKEKREIIPLKNDAPTTYEKFSNARQNAKDNAVSNVGGLLHREMTKQEMDLIRNNAGKSNNYLD